MLHSVFYCVSKLPCEHELRLRERETLRLYCPAPLYYCARPRTPGWQPSSECTFCTRELHVCTLRRGVAPEYSSGGSAVRGAAGSGGAGQCQVAEKLGYLAGAGGSEAATVQRGDRGGER